MSLDELEAQAAPYYRAACAGDPEAFGKLYDLYVPMVYRRVGWKIRHVQDAEDVTEQVFTKALRNIKTYRPDRGPFVAWLRTIADRLVIDYYRTHKETAPIDVDLPIPAADNPEGDVVRSMEAATLRRAIDALQDDHRRIILLRFIEGYNVSEVAKVLGKQEGAVRTAQYRALLSLRKLLGQKAVL